MYGCDPWKDKEDAIERRLDQLEGRNIDHDQALLDLQVEVDNDRAAMQAYASAAVTNVTVKNLVNDTVDDLRDDLQEQIETDVGEMLVNKEDVTNKRQTFQPVPSHTAYPSEKLVKDSLDGKVDSNPAITADTRAKVTYDSKGLVTAGGALVIADIPPLPTYKITAGTFIDARIPTLAISKTTGLQAALDAKIPTDAKGSPNGVAELGADGKVLSGQLPSYVDDVLEYDNLAGFPTPGEAGKIYVAIDANKTYRWSGTAYVEISSSLALGETSATAYRGDRGAQAYAHISATNNPHHVTPAQLGAEVLSNKRASWQSVPTNAAYPTERLVKTELDKKVDSNPAITAGTRAKVTYDSKGLVTAGGDLVIADIPPLPTSKITGGIFIDARIPTLAISKTTGLQDALDAKADASALDGYVPTTRKVNGKPLSADIALTFADVGALSVDTHIPEGSVVDPDFSETSANPIQNKVLTARLETLATKAALDGKQGTLTFDNTPTSGSNNPVKSGGIYDALTELENRILAKLLPPPVVCSELLTMYKQNTTLEETPVINATGCTSLFELFYGCTNLKKVSYIHTPNVTNMQTMFRGCSSLTSIPVMDTSNVTDMRYMFRGCSSLTSIPKIDTSSVTNMTQMFYDCSSLTSVTFTSNVVSPYGGNMFGGTPIASGNGYIYVPDNLVDAYKAASGWSTYASIIKGISGKP